jgi:hypothetical protein
VDSCLTSNGTANRGSQTIGFPKIVFILLVFVFLNLDRLCGLVVQFLATDPEAWVRFSALPEKKAMSLERGLFSLVSTTEELLDKKVAASV